MIIKHKIITKTVSKTKIYLYIYYTNSSSIGQIFIAITLLSTHLIFYESLFDELLYTCMQLLHRVAVTDNNDCCF